ncbi:PadR family transcriptional regulator [Clostridium gasigenes]|uniref:PadR family transcriptional regulator n=1 Tax=Clostridium gasigenes TaxID=94869 RepID=UPI0014384AFE|nr:PadR family transcriptional regulator [Clostridium gasigenes]NKF08872.1 PadR family transcriptional regulator [Clostridium gasigenes]QSW18573.1 PadR family transcriptional regulator [Clostridium gasigenes]
MSKEAIQFLPLTETTYLILCSLSRPLHGYGIMQQVSDVTEGRILLAPGTLYGALSKLSKDNLISTVSSVIDEDKKKNYILSTLGSEVVKLELVRLEKLLRESKILLGVNESE